MLITNLLRMSECSTHDIFIGQMSHVAVLGWLAGWPAVENCANQAKRKFTCAKSCTRHLTYLNHGEDTYLTTTSSD